jgi:RHS repeat-associated protein
VSPSGTLTATTSYDAWGNPHATGGLTTATPFGYAGYYTDPTGMLYLVNRYYDPAAGQFQSADADVAQTDQPYQYASGDPVTVTDPSGLCPYISRDSKQTKCRTDKLLWRWRTILRTFQHYRDKTCGKPQSKCRNHDNTHGKWLDWASDGCSHSPDNPNGFPFWKACERHDFGHRNYRDQGRCTQRWFHKLNKNFFWDMRGAICNHQIITSRPLCNQDANLYYNVVQHRGTC